eukprot:Skav220598  [mRNA]  locus=scaffold2744:224836:226426:+ [translate_table: standard]
MDDRIALLDAIRNCFARIQAHQANLIQVVDRPAELLELNQLYHQLEILGNNFVALAEKVARKDKCQAVGLLQDAHDAYIDAGLRRIQVADQHFGARLDAGHDRALEVCTARAHDCQRRIQEHGGHDVCFPAGTMITLSNGDQVPIQEVKVGTCLLRFDPETRTFAKALVEGVTKHLSILVGVETANGRHIRTTLTHPFYREDVHCWASVIGQGCLDSKLMEGSRLLQVDLEHDMVTSVSRFEEKDLVYSLALGGCNTYFADGILVHNACMMWKLGAAACGGGGAAAGLAVGWAAEEGMKRLTDKTIIIQGTSHAAAAAAGGAAWQLHLPGDTDGNPVLLGYLCDPDCAKPHSHWGEVKYPFWHACLEKALHAGGLVLGAVPTLAALHACLDAAVKMKDVPVAALGLAMQGPMVAKAAIDLIWAAVPALAPDEKGREITNNAFGDVGGYAAGIGSAAAGVGFCVGGPVGAAAAGALGFGIGGAVGAVRFALRY